MALKSISKRFWKKEQVWILKETGSARADKRKTAIFLFSDGASAEVEYYYKESWSGEVDERFIGSGATERVDLNNASYSKSVVSFLRRG